MSYREYIVHGKRYIDTGFTVYAMDSLHDRVAYILDVTCEHEVAPNEMIFPFDDTLKDLYE